MSEPPAGRAAPLQRILVAVRGDRTRGVVIVGPPGDGKTDLAARASTHLAGAGAAVVRIRGRGRAPGVTPAIADLLPASGPPVTDPVVTLAGALRSLRGLAPAIRRPVVLVAYDAHLLDDVSMAVLLAALEQRLIFLLGTVDTDGPAPEHLVPLWKDGQVERMELAPWPPAGGNPPPAGEPDPSTEHCWALHLRGLLLDAALAAREARDSALARDHQGAAAAFATFLAYHLVVRGQVGQAARDASEAADLLAGRDQEPALVARACRVVSLAVQGELAAARCELAALSADRLSPGPGRSAAAWAKAWTAAQTGWCREAIRELRTAADEAATRADRLWELTLRYDVARLGEPEHATMRLEALGSHLPGALVPALVAHARGLAEGDASGLDAAALRLAAIALDLPAAEAAARAAAGHRRHGRVAAAAVSAARAQLWVARCPGVATPALAGLATVLSQREIEIAQLAATGQPSRVLAQQLGVSVRTVDNHLGRCYVKLAVTGRAELRELVCPAGRPPG